MKIEFKPKRPKQIDDITESFKRFLINNKEYIEMTFSIVSTYAKTSDIDEIEESMEFLLVEHGIEDNDITKIYLYLLKEFYDDESEFCHKTSMLGHRRGDILEKIVENMKPVHVKSDEYEIYRECQIKHEGIVIDEQDIDVVYEGINRLEAELIECKANLEKFLGERIPHKKRRKLDFMRSAKLISNAYEAHYENILATCLVNGRKCKIVLYEQGYNEFRVLTALDILRNLK